MTIDERLDRLTERHEALTQSLELLASIQQEHEKHTTRNFGSVLDALSRLERIAAHHEQRRDGLEGET